MSCTIVDRNFCEGQILGGTCGLILENYTHEFCLWQITRVMKNSRIRRSEELGKYGAVTAPATNWWSARSKWRLYNYSAATTSASSICPGECGINARIASCVLWPCLQVCDVNYLWCEIFMGDKFLWVAWPVKLNATNVQHQIFNLKIILRMTFFLGLQVSNCSENSHHWLADWGKLVIKDIAWIGLAFLLALDFSLFFD